MSVEIRKEDDDSIDEVIAENCAIHLERMDKSGWYISIDAKDGSHWQFWLGATNVRTNVVVRHTETTSAEGEPT